MNKITIKLSICIFLISFINFSQEIDESCLPPNKKVSKIIYKAKKESNTKVLRTLSEAKNLQDDNAQIHFEIGIALMKIGDEMYENRPDISIKKYKSAIKSLKNAIALCEFVHADAYFYCGLLYYFTDDNENAITYLTKFKQFKNDDVSRFSDDHAEKLNQVKKFLSKLNSKKKLETKTVPYLPFKVKNVSSNHNEILPMLSPDNELIFYSREVNKKVLGDIISNYVYEFTASRRQNINSEFDGGKALQKPFNQPDFIDYGGATVSLDNKEMIICACKIEKNSGGRTYKNCDLYSTNFKKNTNEYNQEEYIWSDLKNLGEAINSKYGWEAQPSLSSDGNTLYYTVLRSTTRKHDIFVAKRKKDGTWGVGIPFSPTNSLGDDKSPFLHQDSETMYFVSSTNENREGYGGLDVFYINKDEKGNWSQPKNIGSPINSENDETGIIVSTDGKLAYFSSNKKSQFYDIYAFELYEEARPKNVKLIRGEVKNNEGIPIKDGNIEISYSGTNKTEKFKINGDDGKYTAVVKIDKENQKDIVVSINKKGYSYSSIFIDKNEIIDNQIILKGKNLNSNKIKVGEAYTINDILFATNSYELNKKAKFILNGFYRFLNKNSSVKIMIQGHTDNEGNDKNNLILSDNRAKKVKEYLISLGINKNRLSSKGFGETKPKLPNTSYKNKAKNRRTDFVILTL